jgi:hypothetical protein
MECMFLAGATPSSNTLVIQRPFHLLLPVMKLPGYPILRLLLPPGHRHRPSTLAYIDAFYISYHTVPLFSYNRPRRKLTVTAAICPVPMIIGQSDSLFVE